MFEYFDFFNGVKINYGQEALRTIGSELAYLNVKKPLILTDAITAKTGIADKIAEALTSSGVTTFSSFDNISSSINEELIKALRAAYYSYDADGLIAVGDNHVINAAKYLKIFIESGCDGALEIQGTPLAPYDKHISLVCIPTAGDGSETNGYIEDEGIFVSSREALPTVVILDSAATSATPARLTAAAGMVSLASAIESCFNSPSDSPAEIFAKTAIKTLFQNLPIAVKEGDNLVAREKIALASAYSGIAYGNAPCGIVRAISESIAEVCGKPKNEIIGALLPACMNYYIASYSEKAADMLLYMKGEKALAETAVADRAILAKSEVENLLNELNANGGIPAKLSQLNIPREKFGEISELATKKRGAIYSFKPLSYQAVLEILNAAF